MRLYRREKYLSRMRPFYHDEGIIKAIIGVRRCGKSCILQSVIEELREGGFPKALSYDGKDEKRAYVRGIVVGIFEKDIRGRAKVRHVTVFNAVRDYLVSNFGSTTSVTNLLDHFNRVEGIPIKRETLNLYIQILVNAKVLYRCQRFDMKSRRPLQREERCYLADLGFYFATNTDNRIDYGPALESVVYHYARTRGKVAA